MRPVARRYMKEFLPAMAAYVVVLMLSVWALRHVEATALRVLLALAPAIPVAAAARAIVRFVRGSDELDRRILLEAFALAALVLTMGAFSLGLLVMADVVRMRAGAVLVWILPVYCLLYGVFAAIARRRYA